jgi:hypothetical protein
MVFTNIKWDNAKNDWLKANRDASFEAVVAALQSGKLIDDVEHPQRANQSIFIVQLNEYICAVPYVLNECVIFLKTIYPDPKMKAKYRKES